MSPDGSHIESSHQGESAPLLLEADATTLAATIRQQHALPLTDSEAHALANALEDSTSDEELLAATLSAVRLVLHRLGPPGLAGGSRHASATEPTGNEPAYEVPATAPCDRGGGEVEPPGA